jgi:hypothetical protein
MIATGALAQGAEGRNSSYFYKVIDDRSFVIGINLGSLPYAKYPGRDRPFMAFADQTLKEWHKGIRDYICKGRG